MRIISMVLKRSSRLFNDVKHKKEKNLKRVLTRAEYLKEDYSAHGATVLLNVKHIEFIFHLKVLFYTGHDEKDTFTAISNNQSKVSQQKLIYPTPHTNYHILEEDEKLGSFFLF